MTARSTAHRPDGLLIFILALLMGIQPVTTDLYLPALPQITHDLSAQVSQTQLTLTALLLAFGFSQLLWGPLSDRWGRKPILLTGLGLYTLASVGASLAASIELLIAWRTLQGVAMGAAVMAGRAIVRDCYEPEQGARIMSKALTGLGVIAALSAPLGAVLTQWAHWRWALSSLGVFGAVAGLVIAWRFTESLPPARRQLLGFGTLWRNNRAIVGNRTFWAYCALSAASYAGMFMFLSGSAYVLQVGLGMSIVAYGASMLFNAVFYILGTFMCRRLLRRMPAHRAVGIAACLTLVGGVSMYALAHLGWGHAWYGPWAILAPIYLFMVAHGVHQPCAQSGSVAPFPQMAGTASALNGFLMMVLTFFAGGWLGRNLNTSLFAMMDAIALWSCIIAAVAWTLVRRFGSTGGGLR
jgi:MFS transporter, DHA1 family, multidrug resistance protein